MLVLKLIHPTPELVILESLDDLAGRPMTHLEARELEVRLQPLFQKYKTDLVFTSHFIHRMERPELADNPPTAEEVGHALAGAMSTGKFQKLMGRNLQNKVNPLPVIIRDGDTGITIAGSIHHLDTHSDESPAFNNKLVQSKNRQEFRPITIWKGKGFLGKQVPDDQNITFGNQDNIPAKRSADELKASVRNMAKSLGLNLSANELHQVYAEVLRLIKDNKGPKAAIQAALSTLRR